MSLKKEEGRRVAGKTEEQEQMELCQLQDVVISSAKRLQRLTDDILDVSRIESHRLTLQKEGLDINDLISNIIQDCKNQLERQRDWSIANDDHIPNVTNLTINYNGSEKKEGPIFVKQTNRELVKLFGTF